MSNLSILSIDLGASNGRGVVASFDGNKITLQEVHRFANGPVRILSNLHWDTMHLYKETLNCIGKAAQTAGAIASMAIDGWSQDFGILDNQGNLLNLPRHYRDERNINAQKRAFERLSEYELFELSGREPSAVCTLFQLIAMQENERAAIENGKTLLFMPNLLGYFLTGQPNCDVTLASASLLYNPFEQSWSQSILDTYQLPHLLPPVRSPGYSVGYLQKHVEEHTGITNLSKIPLISVAQHDTSSAFLAVEAMNRPDIAFISCGTWTIVGTTVDSPLINQKTFDGKYSNDIGYYRDHYHLVKYMTGLWILQECMREWSDQHISISYAQLQERARTLNFTSAINVEYDAFASPGNMLEKIAKYCRGTGQPEPQNEYETYLCIVRGLAAKYAETIFELQTLTGKVIREIHMVGGGSQDSLLCQLTAQMTGIKVVAGLQEASIIGNILVQLKSLGEISDSKETAQILQNSFQSYEFIT